MSSTKSKRVPASHGIEALVLAGILVLGFGSTAMAQSADNGSNGLAGTWRAQVTVQDCQTGVTLRAFPAMFAFAKGGTVTFTTAGQLPSVATPGLGTWHHMDGHTYSAVSERRDRRESPRMSLGEGWSKWKPMTAKGRGEVARLFLFPLR